MPRGQYSRTKFKIPVHRFSVTFHQADWPRVLKGAKAAKMSLASFLRFCVFSHLRLKEHERQRDNP